MGVKIGKYITIGTNDMGRSKKFYEALLADLDGVQSIGDDDFGGWSDADAEACERAVTAARAAEDPALLSLHVVRQVYLSCWRSDFAGPGGLSVGGAALATNFRSPEVEPLDQQRTYRAFLPL